MSGALLPLLLLAACGGPESAGEACADFVGAYCDKAASCEVPSDRARTEKDCHFYFEVNAPCSELASTTGSIDDCLRRIAIIDCASSQPGYWPAIPTACRWIVQR